MFFQDVLVNKEIPTGTVIDGGKRRTLYTPTPVKFKGTEGADAYADQVQYLFFLHKALENNTTQDKQCRLQ